jgi:hypothetical protein
MLKAHAFCLQDHNGKKFFKLSSSLFASAPRAKTIPVLGPIPGNPPLLVGEDFMIISPSLSQWNTLEECSHNHRLYLQEQGEDVVGIDAAPLVAVMDDITSNQSISQQNSKYATIAAVVGISMSSSSNEGNTLDTSSETSFIESLQQISANQKTIIPSQSKIRLVGIGRAALSGFHSCLPSSYWRAFDKNQEQCSDVRGEHDGYCEDDRETPLLIAQFSLLVDTDKRSEQARQAGRAHFVSPIHAIAEMSQWAAKLKFMHENRQRLVRGLKAASARLEVSSDNALKDHDGIGLLSSGFFLNEKDRVQAQTDILRLLHEFPGDPGHGHSALETVKQWNNYGLGVSAAAFSSIPPLTRTLTEKLQAYYSPQKQATEEHYYEVLSFMAVLSLKDTIPKQDMNWALKCTNTMERMAWAYEKMTHHSNLLRDASEEVSADLRDCGEECTDLW